MSKKIDLESLKYPIGKLKVPKDPSEDERNRMIETIESFPEKISGLTENLSSEELGWTYRPGGWNIRQVVHHCADSHMNSFVRFKLALTEEVPTIKGYFEGRWAEMPDTTEAPISTSLSLIDGLHARWTVLLKSMSEEDFKKKLYHPEHEKELSLTFMLGLYDWHCRHHLAHIKQALAHKGEFNEAS